MLGLMPFQEVLVFSVLLSFILALIYRVLIKPEDMRRIKEDMKFLREKVNSAQRSGNQDEVKRYSSDMMKASQEQFKVSMKPMFASMILFFFFLGWINTTYAEMMITLPFALPFLGLQINWFWWYIIITLPTTMVFRKALGVE